MENDDYAYEEIDIYKMCLEQAKLGSMRDGNGEGALLYVFFVNNGLLLFKNRSRHKRDFINDYGLSYSGFQEHAEQAVVNDAIRFAKDKKDTILSASLFVAGYLGGKPYRYKERKYICMNCASYLKEVLPMYATVIYLPKAGGGWYSYSPFELFREALEVYSYYGKTGEVRLANLEVIEDAE